MRLTAITRTALAAMVLAFAGTRLVAQSGGSPIRKIADVDTASSYGIAEPSSGRFIVYANSKGIHVLDPRTGKATATIDRTTAAVRASYFGGGLSISASGRRLVFVASGESNSTGYAWSVDLDSMTGKPVSAPHRVSIVPAEVARISDDGRWIALVTRSQPGTPGTRKLLVMPSDGGDERMLDSAGRIQTPYWTPDGKAIYYIRGQGRGPAVMRVTAAGGKPDSLASGAAIIGVSPDGQRIAYYPPTNGDRMPLRIADLQGRTIGTITVLRTTDFFVAWSRSNPALLFGRRSAWETRLQIVSLDNGKVSPYTLADRFATSPRFSPNGRQLAALSTVDDRSQLVVFDVTSKQRRVLATTAEPDGESMWSPDGSHIAFLALDSTLMRHGLHVVEVATSRATRLADLGPAKASNTTLFRWRSDGQSIDYITGTTQQGAGAAGSLERVTLNGARSVIRKLPAVPQGPGGTTGGYRLLNDSLVAMGTDYTTAGDSAYLAIVDTRTGAIRTFINRVAYWQLFESTTGELSPDGKWLAFGSRGPKDNRMSPQWAITSLDGKTVRLLGEPMGCDTWPVEWLPNSRALIAVGVQSCDPYGPDVYVVPIDGSPARRLPVPQNDGFALTRDGRSLVVAAYDGFPTSIVALDITKALAARASQPAKPRMSGKN